MCRTTSKLPRSSRNTFPPQPRSCRRSRKRIFSASTNGEVVYLIVASNFTRKLVHRHDEIQDKNLIECRRYRRATACRFHREIRPAKRGIDPLRAKSVAQTDAFGE